MTGLPRGPRVLHIHRDGIAVCSGIVPHWMIRLFLAVCASISRRMHGAGNDFIVFDSRDRQARCRRTTQESSPTGAGHGFDQALGPGKPPPPDTGCVLPASQCRCIELSSVATGAAVSRPCSTAATGQVRGAVTMDSQPGSFTARAERKRRVCRHGRTEFQPAACRFDAPERADTYSLDVEWQNVEIGAVSMGIRTPC